MPRFALPPCAAVAEEVERLKVRVAPPAYEAEVAEQRQREAEACQQQALRAGQIAEVAHHLNEADMKAEAFVKAQADAIAAWNCWVEHSKAAIAACPPDVPWPAGSGCGAHEVKEMTLRELYRVGAAPDSINRNRGFPVGAPPHLLLAGKPSDIPSLLTTVREAHARVLATLREARL